MLPPARGGWGGGGGGCGGGGGGVRFGVVFGVWVVWCEKGFCVAWCGAVGCGVLAVMSCHLMWYDAMRCHAMPCDVM